MAMASEKGVHGVSLQLDAKLGVYGLTLQASVPTHPQAEPTVVVGLGLLDPLPRVPSSSCSSPAVGAATHSGVAPGCEDSRTRQTCLSG